jgi:sterol 14-demethylase
MTATDTPPTTEKTEPPLASGALPVLGHLLQLRKDPIALMRRVNAECGELGEFRIGAKRVVLMSGEDAQEAFFRAPEDQLDQGAAYPFMTPIFGQGVVFDAPPERRAEMLHNHALRDSYMRGHADTITAEVDRMTEAFGEEGELDLLDFFAELTIYTSSACLIGKPFREQISGEFATHYHDLEKGTDPVAYVNPYLPLPSFKRRDQARQALVDLVQGVMDEREDDGQERGDLLDVMMKVENEDGTKRFEADEITGMFISMMFAGHHTTSGTAAWTMIELLRHREFLAATVNELDALFTDGESVSYHAMREMPRLEGAIKEALRLHPPLILLLRVVDEALEYGEYVVEPGKLVGASPAISNRSATAFPNPDAFDPSRYTGDRREDRQLFAWIPFGAGRHRCVGAAFAMMQLKAILATLLTRYEFELAQPSESYRNDHSKMVVQLQQPCTVRYRRRAAMAPEGAGAGVGLPATATAESSPPSSVPVSVPAPGDNLRVVVDLDLCQGHAVCVSEAPEVFHLASNNKSGVLEETPDPRLNNKLREAAKHCPTGAISLVAAEQETNQ